MLVPMSGFSWVKASNVDEVFVSDAEGSRRQDGRFARVSLCGGEYRIIAFEDNDGALAFVKEFARVVNAAFYEARS